MRLFLTLFFFGAFAIVYAFPNAGREVYISVLKNCLKEHGLTRESYANASPRNNTNGIYEKTKCADLCMLKSLDVMKSDGTINHDKAMEHLLSGKEGIQRDTMKTNLEMCIKKKEENDCDTAHNLMMCAVGPIYYEEA